MKILSVFPFKNLIDRRSKKAKFFEMYIYFPRIVSDICVEKILRCVGRRNNRTSGVEVFRAHVLLGRRSGENLRIERLGEHDWPRFVSTIFEQNQIAERSIQFAV